MYSGESSSLNLKFQNPLFSPLKIIFTASIIIQPISFPLHFSYLYAIP